MSRVVVPSRLRVRGGGVGGLPAEGEGSREHREGSERARTRELRAWEAEPAQVSRRERGDQLSSQAEGDDGRDPEPRDQPVDREGCPGREQAADDPEVGGDWDVPRRQAQAVRGRGEERAEAEGGREERCRGCQQCVLGQDAEASVEPRLRGEEAARRDGDQGVERRGAHPERSRWVGAAGRAAER